MFSLEDNGGQDIGHSTVDNSSLVLIRTYEDDSNRIKMAGELAQVFCGEVSRLMEGLSSCSVQAEWLLKLAEAAMKSSADISFSSDFITQIEFDEKNVNNTAFSFLGYVQRLGNEGMQKAIVNALATNAAVNIGEARIPSSWLQFDPSSLSSSTHNIMQAIYHSGAHDYLSLGFAFMDNQQRLELFTNIIGVFQGEDAAKSEAKNLLSVRKNTPSAAVFQLFSYLSRSDLETSRYAELANTISDAVDKVLDRYTLN